MNRHDDRLAPKLLLVVFLPFATGYFLSFFFRNVNAVIAKDLARDFSLTPSDIGLLTSAYLLAFALAQLPVGVLLDRYGPRRVMASLLCVAGLGALIFGLAQDFLVLTLGRAMIGLGVFAGAAMPIHAVDWKPGKPASATVGSSGSTALLTLDVTASALRRPP